MEKEVRSDLPFGPGGLVVASADVICRRICVDPPRRFALQ